MNKIKVKTIFIIRMQKSVKQASGQFIRLVCHKSCNKRLTYKITYLHQTCQAASVITGNGLKVLSWNPLAINDSTLLLCDE